MPLSNAVNNPIVNDPFAPWVRHYDFSGPSSWLVEGRRLTSYPQVNRVQVRSVAEQDAILSKNSGAHIWVDAVWYLGVTATPADITTCPRLASGVWDARRLTIVYKHR